MLTLNGQSLNVVAGTELPLPLPFLAPVALLAVKWMAPVAFPHVTLHAIANRESRELSCAPSTFHSTPRIVTPQKSP